MLAFQGTTLALTSAVLPLPQASACPQQPPSRRVRRSFRRKTGACHRVSSHMKSRGFARSNRFPVIARGCSISRAPASCWRPPRGCSPDAAARSSSSTMQIRKQRAEGQVIRTELVAIGKSGELIYRTAMVFTTELDLKPRCTAPVSAPDEAAEPACSRSSMVRCPACSRPRPDHAGRGRAHVTTSGCYVLAPGAGVVGEWASVAVFFSPVRSLTLQGQVAAVEPERGCLLQFQQLARTPTRPARRDPRRDRSRRRAPPQPVALGTLVEADVEECRRSSGTPAPARCTRTSGKRYDHIEWSSESRRDRAGDHHWIIRGIDRSRGDRARVDEIGWNYCGSFCASGAILIGNPADYGRTRYAGSARSSSRRHHPPCSRGIPGNARSAPHRATGAPAVGARTLALQCGAHRTGRKRIPAANARRRVRSGRCRQPVEGRQARLPQAKTSAA